VTTAVPPAPPALPPPKRGRGRPSPFNDEKVVGHFLDLLRVGNAIHTAAVVSGLGAVGVHAKLRLGMLLEREGRRGKARDFLNKCREATKAAEVSYVNIVAKSASGATPRAPEDAKWMLEHIARRRWGKKLDVEHSKEPLLIRDQLVRGIDELALAVQEEVTDVLEPEKAQRLLQRIRSRWLDIAVTRFGFENKELPVEEGNGDRSAPVKVIGPGDRR
jgi:hypothetical protein